MSRAVTSTAVSRSTKRTSGATSIADSLARRPASSKRKASTTEAGGESSAAAGSSVARKKRARKTATPAAASDPTSSPVARTPKRSKAESSKSVKETPEKRLARFIPSPSAATSERITRAFQHRLYLIDKKLVGDDPNLPTACHFNVLGSTGNVYKVKLEQRPSCTCPDFPRSGLCKHVLFVMLRVLKLDRSDPRVWQKALLTSELTELLDISAVSDGVLASQSVRQRFQELQRISGDFGDEPAAAASAKTVQREITGDCPICYEKMDDGKGKAKEPVVFCKVCGNNVHRDCFDKWRKSKSSSGGQTTCIYCRAVWADPDVNTSVNTSKVSSEYVNLADVSEVHHQPSSLEDLYPESHRWIGFHGRRGRGRGRGR